MAPAQFQDHYIVLQVTPAAAFDDIKKSYRRLALECHPDKNIGNQNATTLFQQARSQTKESRCRLILAVDQCCLGSSPGFWEAGNIRPRVQGIPRSTTKCRRCTYPCPTKRYVWGAGVEPYNSTGGQAKETRVGGLAAHSEHPD
jgi:hypothetical protein